MPSTPLPPRRRWSGTGLWATLSAALTLSLWLATGAPAAPAAPSLADISARTERVAEAYMQAYVARDWDRLAPLLAAEARFQDPTAALVFGGQFPAGKDTVLKFFREGYAAIQTMAFERSSAFFSGHHAVFVGHLAWSLKLRDGRVVHTRMPLVTVLTLNEADQVVDHRDLADYQPFVDAERRTRVAVGP